MAGTLRRLLIASLLLVILLALPQPANAGWWDDFVSKVQEKVSDGVSFVRDEAAPAVGARLSQAKAVIDDPETPDKIGDWLKEASAPVQEKFGELKEFVHVQVVPEVKKVIDAASNITQNLSKEKPHDIEGTTNPTTSTTERPE